jgi:hypothetical protein
MVTPRFLLPVIAVTLALHASCQHIQEIRKEIDPAFATRKLVLDDDPRKEPPDYKNWETLPSNDDYLKAYETYNFFEARLKKLVADSVQKLEPQTRNKFLASQRMWTDQMNVRCNKVWDKDFDQSRLMGSKVMLSYLYCISRETKDRLVTLGIDKPFNEKLDSKNALWGYHFGDDVSTYSGKLNFLQSESAQVKVYAAKEKCNVSGQPAGLSLWFRSNRLYQLSLEFSSPEDSVINAMTRSFGTPRDDPKDYYVTEIRHCLWAGSHATAHYTTPKAKTKPVVWIDWND